MVQPNHRGHTLTAFKDAVNEINTELKLRSPNRKILLTRIEARTVFLKYGGRCVYCLYPLIPKGRGVKAVHLQFYIPLKRGGEPNWENLVPVCAFHKKKYRDVQIKRERLPDYNCFGKLIEDLLWCVVEMHEAKLHNLDSTYTRSMKTAAVLKRNINELLEDVAISMQYKIFSDEYPEKTRQFVEDDNDIATQVADIDSSDNEEKIKEINDSLKQVGSTRQYKIIKRYD